MKAKKEGEDCCCGHIWWPQASGRVKEGMLSGFVKICRFDDILSGCRHASGWVKATGITYYKEKWEMVKLSSLVKLSS